jgi:uncharacterized membrane protein
VGSLMSTRWFTSLVAWSIIVSWVGAQEDRLVDFQKHVQPILEQRCLSCHGPQEAKNDFRVDDRESLVGYVQPGDAAASTLWTDYLATQDAEMLMPPASATEPGGLPIGELLVIKSWIDEGAEGSWAVSPETAQPQPQQTLPTSDLAKWWAFQGLFHPATVHFPVALLTVSAIFVFFSFFNRSSCEPVAYHCLWMGALGAAVACAAGWSYAHYEGYAGVSFDLRNSSIDRHRWAGIFVAVFAFLVIPLARSVRQSGSIKNRIVWLMASLILAGGVSLAGYQGGELTYGEDHYMNYYHQLFPADQTDADSTPAPTDVNSTDSEGSTQDLQPETVETEPAVETEPEGETEPAVETGPPVETQPAVDPEPTADPEPAADPEPVVDPEPAADAEPSADPEPAAEVEPTADSEPSGERS